MIRGPACRRSCVNVAAKAASAASSAIRDRVVKVDRRATRVGAVAKVAIVAGIVPARPPGAAATWAIAVGQRTHHKVRRIAAGPTKARNGARRRIDPAPAQPGADAVAAVPVPGASDRAGVAGRVAPGRCPTTTDRAGKREALAKSKHDARCKAYMSEGSA